MYLNALTTILLVTAWVSRHGHGHSVRHDDRALIIDQEDTNTVNNGSVFFISAGYAFPDLQGKLRRIIQLTLIYKCGGFSLSTHIGRFNSTQRRWSCSSRPTDGCCRPAVKFLLPVDSRSHKKS